MAKKDNFDTLYFDCYSGVSGDMMLGALLDIGDHTERFRTIMSALPISNLTITVEKVTRNHMAGTNVNLAFGDQPMRHLAELVSIIEKAEFSSWVAEKSISCLRRIAEAEATVHNTTIEKVHFHEIGAADTLIDIVGTFVLLEFYGRPECSASVLTVGSGTVKTEHGTLPVPAPATLELLNGIPVKGSSVPYELITPTGAALMTEVCSFFGPMPQMTTQKTGYGAGDRVIEEHPNLLRVVAGTKSKNLQGKSMIMLECNIDDQNPENYHYVMDLLFTAGARDVTLTPVYMKKNRPGILVRVLLDNDVVSQAENIIFQETTTLGIRRFSVWRNCLRRSFLEVSVFDQKINVKVAWRENKPHTIHPEYDDCRRVAERTGIALRQIQQAALMEAGKILDADQSNEDER